MVKTTSDMKLECFFLTLIESSKPTLKVAQASGFLTHSELLVRFHGLTFSLCFSLWGFIQTLSSF